jgi:predicted methyltransferase
MRVSKALGTLIFAVGTFFVADAAIAQEQLCKLLPVPLGLPELRIDFGCRKVEKVDPRTNKPITEEECKISIGPPNNVVEGCVKAVCETIKAREEAKYRLEKAKLDAEIRKIQLNNEDCQRARACYERVRIMCRNQSRNDRGEEERCVLNQRCR